MPKQTVLWIKEERSIDRIKIPVDQGKYLKLESESMAWERLRELCYPMRGLGSGLHMIIDSRWSLPITPHKDIIPAALLATHTDYTDTFRGSFNATKEISARDRAKANQSDFLLYSLLLAIFFVGLFWFLTTKFTF